jgi:hypothetical protein
MTWVLRAALASLSSSFSKALNSILARPWIPLHLPNDFWFYFPAQVGDDYKLRPGKSDIGLMTILNRFDKVAAAARLDP